ncbi:MAG: PQQ-dependent sugar dehydrogenase [Formosimonas sp.]
MKLWASALLALMWAGAAQAQNPYPSAGVCGGLPKVNLKTPTGTCVGVLAHDLKMPRGVLPLSDQEIWLTEMGSWEKNTGRLSRLTWQAGRYQRSTITDKLDRPHGIVQANNGSIVFAEAGQIATLDLAQLTARPLISHLPNTGHHPLKQLAFDAAGQLYISVGATSNACEPSHAAPCTETIGPRATASIWHVRSPFAAPQISVWARGLRNVMGMTFSPQGELLVTENGRDNITQADPKLNDNQLPHDELNLITQGQHYGWPYCYDANRTSPEYRGKNACKSQRVPLMQLPAHSAPLGLTRYPDHGEIKELRGHYLLALHGYRDTGHQVVKVKIGVDGRPTGKSSPVISGWARTDTQPMGAPVEVRVSPSGKVYITDDRNDVLLRLSNSP